MTVETELFFTTECGLDMRLDFVCEYTPGTPDYFCNGHGNWLPGDAPECEIVSISCDGIGLAPPAFLLFKNKFGEKICNRILSVPPDVS